MDGADTAALNADTGDSRPASDRAIPYWLRLRRGFEILHRNGDDY